jgi:hypothetical protein
MITKLSGPQLESGSYGDEKNSLPMPGIEPDSSPIQPISTHLETWEHKFVDRRLPKRPTRVYKTVRVNGADYDTRNGSIECNICFLFFSG